MTRNATRATDFFNIPATGRSVSCETVELLKISDGKVVENTSSFDVYGMFQQMGALPSPEQLKPVGGAEAAAKAKPEKSAQTTA